MTFTECRQRLTAFDRYICTEPTEAFYVKELFACIYADSLNTEHMRPLKYIHCIRFDSMELNGPNVWNIRLTW